MQDYNFVENTPSDWQPKRSNCNKDGGPLPTETFVGIQTMTDFEDPVVRRCSCRQRWEAVNYSNLESPMTLQGQDLGDVNKMRQLTCMVLRPHVTVTGSSTDCDFVMWIRMLQVMQHRPWWWRRPWQCYAAPTMVMEETVTMLCSTDHGDGGDRNNVMQHRPWWWRRPWQCSQWADVTKTSRFNINHSSMKVEPSSI